MHVISPLVGVACQVGGLLVAQAPPDTCATGQDCYGKAGIVLHSLSRSSSYVHDIALDAPSAQGRYKISFYPVRGDCKDAASCANGGVLGPTFNFDYEINCHGITRPLASYTYTIYILIGAVRPAHALSSPTDRTDERPHRTERLALP